MAAMAAFRGGWLAVVQVLLTLTAVSWSYYMFVTKLMIPLVEVHSSIGLILLILAAHIILILFIKSLHRFSSEDPGYLTADVYELYLSKASEAGVLSSAKTIDKESLLYCKVCDLMRPERVYHCNACGSCVLRYEYHCGWFGNCVGIYNVKFYIMALFYCALWFATVSASLIFVASKDSQTPSSWLDTITTVCMVLIVLVSCGLLMNSGSRVRINLTFPEMMQRIRKILDGGYRPYFNPYHTGYAENIKQIFGPSQSPLDLINPWSARISHDGLTYPRIMSSDRCLEKGHHHHHEDTCDEKAAIKDVTELGRETGMADPRQS